MRSSVRTGLVILLAVHLPIASAQTEVVSPPVVTPAAPVPIEVPSPWTVPAGHRRFEWLLDAALTLEGQATREWWEARATASVRGEIRIQAAHCPLLTIGAEGGAFVDHGGTASHGFPIEQWASLCIDASPLPSFRIDHDLEMDARPRLSSPREFLAREYTRERIGFHLIAVDIPGFGAWSMQLFDVHPHFVILTQSVPLPGATIGATIDETTIQTNADMSLLRFHRREADPETPERFVEIFSSGISFYDSFYSGTGLGAGALHFYPARTGNLPLGRSPLRLDLDIGFSHGDIEDTSKPPNDKGVYPTLVSINTAIGTARVHGEFRGVYTEAAYTRSLFPDIERNLNLEDRVEGSARFSRRGFEVKLDPFFARTKTYRPDGSISRDFTGGGDLEVARNLGHHVRFAVDAEVARSFYARLGGDDSQPHPAFGVKVVGVLQTQLGRRL